MAQFKSAYNRPHGLYQFSKLLQNLKGKKTLTDFAEHLGVSRTTIENLLKQQAEPSLKTLYQISQLTPYTMQDLISIIYEMEDNAKELPKTGSDAFRFTNNLDDLELQNLLVLIYESRSCKFAKMVLPIIAQSSEEKIHIVETIFKTLPEPIQKKFLTTWIATFLTF